MCCSWATRQKPGWLHSQGKDCSPCRVQRVWNLSRLPLRIMVPAFPVTLVGLVNSPTQSLDLRVCGQLTFLILVDLLSDGASPSSSFPFSPLLNSQKFSLNHLIELYIFIKTSLHCVCKQQKLCGHHQKASRGKLFKRLILL